MLRKLLLVVVGLNLLPAILFAADPSWVARSRTGMVASDSPEASQIGADVLAAGGNAFDAAIATSLALSVARPQSTGLGGGGFMVAYLAQDKRAVVLDFREVAPAAATAERYADLNKAKGDGPSPTVYGGNAVGVPGQVAGLAEIHRRFATRPLRDLVQPAIRLAEGGFVVDEHYRDSCVEVLADCEKWPQLKERYARLYETVLGKGSPPGIGEKVVCPDLAWALRLIGEQGPETFYKGEIADAIVKAVQAAGGALTKDDLAGYRVREREALRGRWGEFEVVTMPPPSSGGVCLVETLNVLSVFKERMNPRELEVWQSEHSPDCLVNALKHAFADRARWLGDPDFGRIPVARLVSRAYAEELAQKPAKGPDDFGSTRPPDDGGTSHFCVVDRDGNIVAMTQTINDKFGSLVVAEPFGIILNNEMDDFAADPGRPNLYGLIQGEANAVAPGKRPLSSMSPTIVFRAGRPVLVLGGSGGPRIITSVVQVLLNVIEFNMPLDEAVNAVRLHHQWQPDEVCFDREPPENMVAALKGAGQKMSEKRKIGVVQAIQVLGDGTLIGASDPRKGGRPAGLR